MKKILPFMHNKSIELAVVFLFLVFQTSFLQAQTVTQTDLSCSEEWIGPTRDLTGAVARALSTTDDEGSGACTEGNVRQIRQLMALTYGTCEALNPIRWELKERGRFFSGINNPPKANESDCGTYTDSDGNRTTSGTACRTIACHSNGSSGVMDTHPYNKLARTTTACRQKMQCRINPNESGCTSGSAEQCPVIFSFDSQRPPYLQASNENETIDIFRNKSQDRKGSRFIGWNCSEYVTTAMALAGYRLVPKVSEGFYCDRVPGGNIGEARDNSGALQQYNARMYKNLASRNCSCLDTVDITEDTIQQGDLITLGEGHIMMVEAVKQPLFKNITKIEDCHEENIGFDTLQIRLNHSSGTNGGPGSTRFFEHQYPNYVQTLRSAVSKYKARCGYTNSAGQQIAGTELCAAWDSNDQAQYTQYYYNLEKLGCERPESSNLCEDGNEKWQTEVGNGLFPEAESYPMWPSVRKRLSILCQIHWKKQNNESVSNLESMLSETTHAFTVIRHDGDKTGCMNDNPPKLDNCLGPDGCPDDKVNQCTYDL